MTSEDREEYHDAIWRKFSKRSGQTSRRQVHSHCLSSDAVVTWCPRRCQKRELRWCKKFGRRKLRKFKGELNFIAEIFHSLSKLNVPMDISHYNALLRVYLENEYSFSPTEFLADLQSKGVEPNR